ncbi:unnamed protein product [Effrenium voratum]|nr:unnamed protein product [Effrenium voratum]|mmetsp:Transcript_68811/g.163927  ORF Transcript_68811/g.163927 Transcript_68811/m.163927 type:complete len:399 (-) Transcript_68811:211-1407(-)|eukprot:CAMPEP_0181487418 /NCGR_PEP_ID=MMETSP1110-20121109/47801_1 /TAXON_ID=174948 /ORGANISM="Symbiodinium sp., Strain CCMP421" /LENGTH=398 /DNA_ID=CAMNT_0023613909 /DNA_START=66 /DNA_END=1262 /DNA_ORIENTATION=-
MKFFKSVFAMQPIRCMESQETAKERSGNTPRSSKGRLAAKRNLKDKASFEPVSLFGALRGDSDPPSTVEPWSESESPSSCRHSEAEILDLETCIEKVCDVKRWKEGRFQEVRLLQNAARNQGRVELMKELSTGKFVAVKRMPVSWTGLNHKDFQKKHPKETEMPWLDIAMAKFLHGKGLPFACEVFGTYRDESETFFVSEFATKGDLFDWSQNGPTPGLERENFLKPVVQQLFTAMRILHSLNIAHLDLSLENTLLTEREDGSLQLKLIDFGMTVVDQHRLAGARGKPSYQAPEMHDMPSFDPLIADTFSVGVVLFGMVGQDYPWLSTRPQGCKCFDFVRTKGLRAYFQKRKARNSNGARLSEVLSEPLMDLLDGVLQVLPADRARLEQDFQWLRDDA